MFVSLKPLGQKGDAPVFSGALAEDCAPSDLLSGGVAQRGYGPMADHGGLDREVHCALRADASIHRITGIAVHDSDQVFADGRF